MPTTLHSFYSNPNFNTTSIPLCSTTKVCNFNNTSKYFIPPSCPFLGNVCMHVAVAIEDSTTKACKFNTNSYLHGSCPFLGNVKTQKYATPIPIFKNKIMIPSTITCKFGRCDASRHPNVLYLLNLGSVNDQRKYLSLFFIRNDSRCYAAGKHVPSKNKDVKFFVKTLSQRLTKNI